MKHNGLLGLGAITWDAVGIIKRKGDTMNSHIQQAASTSPGVIRVNHFRGAVFWLLMTFFTIFASSTRNARRILRIDNGETWNK
jgi:hypothetical protein